MPKNIWPQAILLEAQVQIIYGQAQKAYDMISSYLTPELKDPEALYRSSVALSLLGKRRQAIKQLKQLREQSSSELFNGKTDSLIVKIEEKSDKSI